MRSFLLIGFVWLLCSCQSGSGIKQVVYNEDSLRFFSQQLIGDKEGWIMMGQPGTCWHCNGYFYYLGKEIGKKAPLKLILLTTHFRKAAVREMKEGLGWDFSPYIVHLSDKEMYAKFLQHSGGQGKLIHLKDGQIEVYPIDDRDAMDEQWPEIEKIIREGS